MGLESNRHAWEIQTPTTGRLPRPVAKTTTRPSRLLFLNILHHLRRVYVQALGRHSVIRMFVSNNIEIIFFEWKCNGRQGRLQFKRPGRDSKHNVGPVYTRQNSTLLSHITIPRYDILSKAFNCGVNCHQIELNIDIRCYSNVWRSISTGWRVFVPLLHDYHIVALVPGKILLTINLVYVQLAWGNPPLAELTAS